jgi:CheY-like chemotaxis protein
MARILVVDDDPDFLDQTCTYLEAGGHETLRASSGAEGEELADNTRPDMAVIDLMLEEADRGFILAYNLKKKNPDMPVIMVSGVAAETGMVFDATTGEEREWIRADAFLDKPVRGEQLLSEVSRLLER